jgi:hypothetical protein
VAPGDVRGSQSASGFHSRKARDREARWHACCRTPRNLFAGRQMSTLGSALHRTYFSGHRPPGCGLRAATERAGDRPHHLQRDRGGHRQWGWVRQRPRLRRLAGARPQADLDWRSHVLMTRTMRGDSTSGGAASMRGNSARKKRCPCRTALILFGVAVPIALTLSVGRMSGALKKP